MIKHSQITQSNKFSLSVQWLKKEVRSGGQLWHADKCQSFYKLVLSFLMEVTRHVQNTQNRKLVIFCNILRKILVSYWINIDLSNSSLICIFLLIFFKLLKMLVCGSGSKFETNWLLLLALKTQLSKHEFTIVLFLALFLPLLLFI